jgi:hypothetical protein
VKEPPLIEISQQQVAFKTFRTLALLPFAFKFLQFPVYFSH